MNSGCVPQVGLPCIRERFRTRENEESHVFPCFVLYLNEENLYRVSISKANIKCFLKKFYRA